MPPAPVGAAKGRSDSLSAQIPFLARAASGLSLLACLGAALAFLREAVLATEFGAGAFVDAYLVAVALPVLVTTSIVSTFEAAFIPLYLACKTEGGAVRSAQFAGETHLWLLAGGVALALGLSAALPLILPFQAPGFGAGQLALAGRLAWFTAPSVLFAGLYALGRSVLNAERRYLAPALAPGIGACVMLLVILFGHGIGGITAAAVGYTAGVAAMWLTVFIPIVAADLPGRRIVWGWRNADTRRLVRATGPLLAGVAAMSAIPVVDRLMASRFPPGVISALAYADRVVQVPITIVVAAVTTAIFPVLSRYAAERDLDGLRRMFGVGIRLLAMLLVPIAVLLMVLSEDVIAVLFRRGQFTASDVQTTAVVLSGLAAGLVFMGTFQLVPRVFNAMQLGPFVALSGFLNLGFKTSFNLLFVPAFGYRGFALATSAMYVGTGAVMLWLLDRRMGGLELKLVLPSLVATSVGSALMAVVGSGVSRGVHESSPLLRLAMASGPAILVYIGTLWVLNGRPAGWAAWLQGATDDRVLHELR